MNRCNALMDPLSQTGLDPLTLAEAAECLKTMGHPHRLRMIQLMLRGRYSVGQLAAACDIPSSVASGHLRILKDRHLLSAEREGRTVYYRVTKPGIAEIVACVESKFTQPA